MGVDKCILHHSNYCCYRYHYHYHYYPFIITIIIIFTFLDVFTLYRVGYGGPIFYPLNPYPLNPYPLIPTPLFLSLYPYSLIPTPLTPYPCKSYPLTPTSTPHDLYPYPLNPINPYPSPSDVFTLYRVGYVGPIFWPPVEVPFWKNYTQGNIYTYKYKFIFLYIHTHTIFWPLIEGPSTKVSFILCIYMYFIYAFLSEFMCFS
jgi:hypothetical protein